MLRLFIPPHGVVVGAQVVVHIQVLLRPAEHIRVVARDAGEQAGVSDNLDGRRHLIQIPLREQVIHDSPVDVACHRAARDCAPRAGLGRTDLRAGLGEPLDLPAFAPVLEQKADYVIVRAGDERVNAQRLRLADGVLDPLRREPALHPQVNLGALVGEAAERIASEDEAAHSDTAERYCVHVAPPAITELSTG